MAAWRSPLLGAGRPYRRGGLEKTELKLKLNSTVPPRREKQKSIQTNKQMTPPPNCSLRGAGAVAAG